jgi:hypothetical protein
MGQKADRKEVVGREVERGQVLDDTPMTTERRRNRPSSLKD